MDGLTKYDSGDDDQGPVHPAPPPGGPAPARPQQSGATEGGNDEDDDEEMGLGDDVFGLVGGSGKAKPVSSQVVMRTMAVSSVPDVLPSTDYASSNALIMRPTDTVMNVNVSYDDLTRPVQGPSNPYSDRKLQKMNVLNGHVEEEFMNDIDFNRQQRSFHVLSYAKDPSLLNPNGPGYVGNLQAAVANHGDLVGEQRGTKAAQRSTKRKRSGKGELGVFDPDDPDELREQGGSKEYQGPWAAWAAETSEIAPTGPEEEEYEAPTRDTRVVIPGGTKRQVVLAEGKREVSFGEEKSIFHGSKEFDYQGRTYMHVPTTTADGVDLRGESGEQECFAPKRCVHTWTGHTKGVSCVRLFPGSGHLILSGSMDTRIKLWDVYNEGKCLRTFMGHSKAVRDVTFSNDGRTFLSAGYDRQMKLWDTETGQCLKAFSNGKIPFCIKFHPDQDKQHIFLAGMGDKKIIQYDMNSGEITQEYDQHLGPVNTITFVDENRRFVTTSDDKTIRAWDFDIPVVIKYIAEPAMHSMPAVGVHPNKKWLAMQSMDNQILIYSAENFKQNRKKRFAGHTTSGYACEVAFSPDGRWVSSGDGAGGVVFWDWKTGKIVRRLHRCHDKVVISHAWLPHETSKIVTASWDGLIKLWD